MGDEGKDGNTDEADGNAYVEIITLVNKLYLNLVGVVHWGIVGPHGEDKKIKSGLFSNFRNEIQKELEKKITEGYDEMDQDELFTLLIEINVDGHGTTAEVDERHKLDDKMKVVLTRT